MRFALSVLGGAVVTGVLAALAIAILIGCGFLADLTTSALGLNDAWGVGFFALYAAMICGSGIGAFIHIDSEY